MRLALGWLIVSIALIVGGGQMTHDAANNGSAPQTVSIQEVIKGKPDKTWLKITDGILVLPATTWMEEKKTKRIDELFIPIVAPDEKIEGMRIHVLLRTKRPELIGRIREMRAHESSEAEAEKYLIENMQRLFLKDDVKGMVEWGIDSNTETRDAIAKLSKNLQPGFMILRDGKEPQGSTGMALLVGGVVLLLGGGAYLFGGKIQRPGRSGGREVGRREPIIPERVAPEEPRMIEVGSDFARELGLENAPTPKKPVTKKVEKPRTKKVVKPAEKPAAAPKPLTKSGTKKVVKGMPERPPAAKSSTSSRATATPVMEKPKTKPLLARKKRPLA